MSMLPATQERQEHAVFWRDGALAGLELLRASYVTHSFVPHAHEGFAIGAIEAGADRFAYRRGVCVAPAGALVLINPAEPHTGAAATPDGWRYRMLYPEATMLQQAATELTGRARAIPYFRAPVVDDPPLARALLRLHAALEAQAAAEPLERESRLLDLLATLIERHADALHLSAEIGAEPGLARLVRDYLEAHAHERVALADLARLTGASGFQVVRRFQQVMGLPPHAFLTQIRVGRAKRLLAQRVPPAQVAAQVGFYDQSHLTRHFKRIVGVPPSQYAGPPARSYKTPDPLGA
jgi:AraC-like DNA-binding protein